MGSKHVNIFAVKCMNNHIKQRNVSNIVCLFKSDLASKLVYIRSCFVDK